MHAPIYVADCVLGKGVFAASAIPPGAHLLAFTGPLIDVTRALAKEHRSGDALQIAPDQYIDPDPPGLFVNHSCDPNAGIRPGNRLVALRAIAHGEEIFFDYSTTMLDRLWSMECKCQSPQCRGTILDFDLLPPQVAERYVTLGVVQDFIIRASMKCRAACEP